MRLDWIEDILAVLDNGSLARAAEKRFLTQSAFTRRVRMIEDSIGATLFDRSRKPVALMPGVKALEPEMRRLSMQLRRLKHDLKQTTDPLSSVVSIACQHALTTTLSSKIVGALTAGDRTVRMRSGNRDECLIQLFSGEADIAITYQIPGERTPILAQAFEAHDLGADRLIPVCIPDLEDSTHNGEIPAIGYPSDVFLGQVFDRTIVPRLSNKVVLSPRAETALTLAMIQLVLDGIGVAWLPQSLILDHLAQKRLIKPSLNLPEQELEIKMIRLAEGQSPQNDAIWSLLSNDVLKRKTL
ncbi:LysR family transcriptional regulator [Pseudohalocynthiibacter aestuariivivens]|uniref:LysR family transcriptional regulator n=1 Tax=Pseudohalocynthiibacter aestuariivivens TaxID=1591409 RepID=A0ABV5JCZ5_9RHOB|nr:LysR family transcriptional regulator [Pseudohalocynthiibacter aestuariivivens]MBS9717293.1 LysR family transcriptional regulator [Pseudohalocynthiibacter aestuariivivens]